MDDIGLEANIGTVFSETTYSEQATTAKAIAHKDAHIRRFFELLIESGFTGEQLRNIDNALSAAGVCIMPLAEVEGAQP